MHAISKCRHKYLGYRAQQSQLIYAVIIMKSLPRCKISLYDSKASSTSFNQAEEQTIRSRSRTRSKVKSQVCSQRIRVLVRPKPSKEQPAEDFRQEGNSIKTQHCWYSFDRIFDAQCSQEAIFKEVESGMAKVLQGFNYSVIAYGATGSGKTYTMFGKEDQQGMIPRACSLLLGRGGLQFDFTCSMLEVYREHVHDLLTKDRAELKVKEDASKGFFVQRLTEVQVLSCRDISALLEYGQSQRKCSSTRLNQRSSRSHTLFVLKAIKNGVVGRLTLVDLAGSENISKSGASGEVLEQAKKINLSLSSLGKVITALTSGSDHVPYRQSKLTKVLQESLGKNSSTVLLVNISTVESALCETANALKFAARAKLVKTSCRVQLPQCSEVERLRGRVQQLEEELNYYKARDRTFSTTEDSDVDDRVKPTKLFYIDLLE